MSRRHRSSTSARSAAAALLLLCAVPSAHALLRLNDGRDQVYVTAFVGAGYDSNVFTSGTGDNADVVITGGAGLEYSRKAGLIGVNANLGWNFGRFSTFTDEDFLNPSASLELSKGTGRTTGAMQFNTKRDVRADPTIGLRTESWNHNVNLNYRYPVIERYSFAGNIGWSILDYVDNDGPAGFADLTTYTIGTDLFYNWRSDRDLMVGHRYRTSETSATSTSNDHSVYVGVNGRIYSKLSGGARVGWTYRVSEFPAPIPEDTNDGLYASVSATWPASQKISYTLVLSQDFSTTSTNFQTQTTSLDLSGQFTHTVKFSTSANLGVGHTRYISGYSGATNTFTEGFNNQDRSDTNYSFGLGANYTVNKHLSVSLNYGYTQNTSNLSSFVFERHSAGVTVSTRW
ncbi:MAG: outer membrane beta-barrel protein [Opitutaceae bacterium]|jgi:hypothetical protein|nr:outer membrane beta-barrel protein [Opitutaceae bacterium]